jgi:pyocin large subunit-like protein
MTTQSELKRLRVQEKIRQCVRVPSASRYAVLQVLVNHLDGNGSCYPSVQTIADQCGISKRTVQRATADLESLGLIQITKRLTTGKGKIASGKFHVRIVIPC